MARDVKPEWFLTTSTYNSKTKKWGYKVHESREAKSAWLREITRLPGEFNFDKRVEIFTEQARVFQETGIYNDLLEGSIEWVEYWDRQKELSYTGVLVDDQFYITGDHYFYLNFLKIPDKVKKDFAFARFQDLDVWAFYCIEQAILDYKFLACVKARQTGFSLKFVARLIKRLWFERSFSGKIGAFDDTYLSSNWMEILIPYRDHLNSHTAWYRQFDPSDEKYNWKQGTRVTEDGKKKWKGLLSTLKAKTTQQKASAVVSGKTDELFYDEAGVSLNVDKVIELAEPALKFGNILTGYLWMVGAAGETKESEALQKIIYAPKAHRCLEFPNVWSGRPDEMVGMFVPYYYSYGDCIDQFGNSLIQKAKEEYAREADEKKQKSYVDYALFRAQYPETLEDAFSIQEENIFPTEIIQPWYDELIKTKPGTVITLVDAAHSPTGVAHKFGSESPVVEDFPLRKGTDKRGALTILEFPPENPPPGLYYVTVDPIRSLKTDTSVSLHSITIYKAAHRIDNEFSEDVMVGWYCGRHDDFNETFKLTKRIMKRWNARTAIESDQASCIEWMIKEKMSGYMMKRSDMPILKEWVPTSKIHEEYGFRTGSGNTAMKDHFYTLIIEYCSEVIGTEFDKDGNARDIYGVVRIKDPMLLKELLMFRKSKGNYDRIISFGAALMVARANTNRGIMATSKPVTEQKREPVQMLPTLLGKAAVRSPFNKKIVLGRQRSGLMRNKVNLYTR